MKKKNDEKKQKILKVIKIIGCSLGLLLCGGLFIGLLVVGIRGCVSQSNKKVDNETTLKAVKDTPNMISSIDELQEVTINNVNYYPFVFVTPQIDSNVNVSFVTLGGYEQTYHVKTLINGVERNFYTLYTTRLSDNGGYLQEYTFYNVPVATKTDIIGFSFSSNDNSAFQSSSNFNVGDIINFEVEGFKGFYNKLAYTALNYPFAGGAFTPYLNKDIIFNNVINPFGPYGTNFDFFINSQLSGPKTLFKGLFKDATGTIYKKIELSYLSAQGMRYGTVTDYQTYTLDGSHYMYMAYYTLEDTQIIVNAQDYGTAISGNQEGNVVMLKSNHFISNLFQSINIMTISNDGNYISPTLDRLVALTSLNNSNTGTAIYSDGGTIGGTNPFILIGSAFSSLMPLLNTTIIPGLTIGTLLLIPLVGMIVLFVVFLFKR